MIRTSSVSFEGDTRFHLALNVSDVQASIAFYRQVFDLEPIKQRPGYAKFESSRPSLNFTLNQSRADLPARGALSHMGVQLKDTGHLERIKNRLQQLGLVEKSEEGVSCCYALQDKFWVTDPDGNALEFFVVLADDEPVAQDSCATGCAC